MFGAMFPSGISGLSFDSSVLSALMFFCLVLLVFLSCSFFLQMSVLLTVFLLVFFLLQCFQYF